MRNHDFVSGGLLAVKLALCCFARAYSLLHLPKSPGPFAEPSVHPGDIRQRQLVL
jgi:hypothetical protein